MNPVLTALLVAIPVAGGATLQRTTGLGLALVGGPFLVAALGAQDGVSFGNALQTVLCLLVLAGTWRDHPLACRRCAPARARRSGAPVGALLVELLPEGPLLVVVGGLALLGIGLAALPAGGRRPAGWTGALTSGAAAGFVNAAAGVGGPLAVGLRHGAALGPQQLRRHGPGRPAGDQRDVAAAQGRARSPPRGVARGRARAGGRGRGGRAVYSPDRPLRA